jgi:hypothetical protein
MVKSKVSYHPRLADQSNGGGRQGGLTGRPRNTFGEPAGVSRRTGVRIGFVRVLTQPGSPDKSPHSSLTD